MATSFFYIYVIATSFFYIYVMAPSFYYIYVMATSFFYIYFDSYIDITLHLQIDGASSCSIERHLLMCFSQRTTIFRL